ncbi:MAG: L,D-transpeptidase [Anaerolineae bacterium]
MITRRDFLRLSLYSLGWAALWPAYRRFWWQLREGPVRMGRAIHPVIIYDAPKRDARRIGTWNGDDVFPIVREVRAPGLNAYNDLWYETPDGYVFSAWVQPMWVWPPQAPETHLGDWGFWGEVCVPYTEARKEPHPDAPIAYRFYNRTTYHVVGIAWDDRGNAWYKIYDELPPTDYQWVLATDIRRLTRRELAPIHPFAGAKRIEIDLSQQTVTCYEGNRVVFTCRCASGIGNSTPEGDHTVILKQVSRHMSNRPQKPEDPVPADLFDLPGVPWNTFFDTSGTAIHGTYWHNDYGVPRSHGCVNVSIDAARWIYRWVYPIGGAEDDFIQGDKQVGTPIRIFRS